MGGVRSAGGRRIGCIGRRWTSRGRVEPLRRGRLCGGSGSGGIGRSGMRPSGGGGARRRGMEKWSGGWVRERCPGGSQRRFGAPEPALGTPGSRRGKPLHRWNRHTHARRYVALRGHLPAPPVSALFPSLPHRLSAALPQPHALLSCSRLPLLHLTPPPHRTRVLYPLLHGKSPLPAAAVAPHPPSCRIRRHSVISVFRCDFAGCSTACMAGFECASGGITALVDFRNAFVRPSRCDSDRCSRPPSAPLHPTSAIRAPSGLPT